jgi:type III secretory pathway lipoprotein EscJ
MAFDDKPPTATASVLIRHRGPTPPIAAQEVQRLVAGAIPGLAPEQVSVVMVPAPPRGRPPERQLARLGPLTVTHASLFALRSMIGVVVLLNAALLACVVGLWGRLRRSEQRLQQAQQVSDGTETPARRRTGA